MKKGNPLGERDQCKTEIIHSYAIGHRSRDRQLILVVVKKGLIVVRRNVVDDIDRIFTVTRGLAVVAQLSSGHQIAVTIYELIISDGSGQSQSDEIGCVRELSERSARE